jgi:hypothetical protein
MEIDEPRGVVANQAHTAPNDCVSGVHRGDRLAKTLLGQGIIGIAVDNFQGMT